MRKTVESVRRETVTRQPETSNKTAPNDPSGLLSRIEASLEDLKAGRISRHDSVESLMQWLEGWPMYALNDVVEVNPRVDKGAIPDNLPVTFVPMSAVGAGDGVIHVDETRPAGDVKKGFTAFLEGDVLFAKITPCMENGKMAVVPRVVNGYGYGSTEFHVLRPTPAVGARYLYYFVSSQSFRTEAKRYMTGAVGQQRVPTAYLKDCKIPVPPLDQQKRIVAEIEKQFSRLDEAVASLKRVKANLKRYKAAVLKAAVEGRLVETEAEIARREGRSFETGAQLLERILETRRSQWKGKGKYKEPAGPDTTDLPELPEGWVWCGFEQVSVADKHALKAGPFGSSLKKEFYVESGYKIYGQEQVIRGDSMFGDYFIDEMKYRELESCAVKPGDLLISLVGTTGKVLVLPQNAMPGIINPRLLKLSLNHAHVAPEYAAYMLQSSWASYYFKLQAHGGTMEILNLGIIKALPVPLPPLSEQHRIVDEVDRRLSLVREVDSQVDADLQRAERLRQSILSQAFSGELVKPAATHAAGLTA